ncbi:hypothetical protein ACQPW3_11340 [Actinosynnema sp. CA-248983]
MREDELRELVDQVFAELPELVPDAAERAEVAAAVRAALDREDPWREVVAVLRAHPATEELLVRDHDRLIAGQAGDVVSPVGVLFMCPNGDHAIVLETATDEVLRCPQDGAVLERVEG